MPGTGSAWSLAVTAARLVMTAPLAPPTVATSARVAAPALATPPTVHTPVPDTYAPWLGVPERKVTPAGSRSVRVTPVAASGPWLLSVTA